jgi:hypothetical protein
MIKVNTIILILFFVLVADSLAMKKQKDIPEILLEDTAWSFAEPISSSPSEFVNAVVLYHKEVLDESFDTKYLTSKSPLVRLDIKYNYAVQIPGNTPWDDVTWIRKPMVVRIKGNGTYLTYAEILWQLHKEVHKYLKDQDNHYFEGLALLPNSNKGTPVYELYLGS